MCVCSTRSSLKASNHHMSLCITLCGARSFPSVLGQPRLPLGLASRKQKWRRREKEAYLAKALAAFLAWTSLLMRMVSRLTGLGTKPTTPSSFTGRPIHHSLLNFCSGWRKPELNRQRDACLFRLTVSSALYTVWDAVASMSFKPLWHGGSPWPRRWPPGPALERCRRLPVCTRSCNAPQMPQACTEETQSQNMCLIRSFALATKLLQSMFYKLKHRGIVISL